MFKILFKAQHLHAHFIIILSGGFFGKKCKFNRSISYRSLLEQAENCKQTIDFILFIEVKCSLGNFHNQDKVVITSRVSLAHSNHVFHLASIY